MKRIPVGDTFATVDDADYKMLSKFKWHQTSTKNKDGKGYAQFRHHGKRYYMHRLVVKAVAGQEVDHIDRNPLNNQRSNLRICTHRENALNRGLFKNNKSGHRYVSYHSETKKWMVCISRLGRNTHLGRFKKLEDAVRTLNLHLQELSNAN